MAEDAAWYTEQAAWAALRTAAKKAGVRDGLHPHLYRHSLAIRARQAGIDKSTRAAMLGHSSTRYIERYDRPTIQETTDGFRKLLE